MLLLLSVIASSAHGDSPSGAGTNLSIAGGSARLVGPEALIRVECEGPRDALCSGTVSVSSGGESRQAPYSVLAGSSQSLAVTVGRGFAASGATGLAVARTAQPAGGYSQSRAVLRFR